MRPKFFTLVPKLSCLLMKGRHGVGRGTKQDGGPDTQLREGSSPPVHPKAVRAASAYSEEWELVGVILSGLFVMVFLLFFVDHLMEFLR